VLVYHIQYNKSTMIYVDNAFISWKRGIWSHLVSDTSEQELHLFAQRIGLRRSWFQDGRNPHYDVTKSVRAKAIILGAIECEYYDILNHNYAYIQRKNSVV
jgi:hypothetical protein